VPVVPWAGDDGWIPPDNAGMTHLAADVNAGLTAATVRGQAASAGPALLVRLIEAGCVRPTDALADLQAAGGDLWRPELALVPRLETADRAAAADLAVAAARTVPGRPERAKALHAVGTALGEPAVVAEALDALRRHLPTEVLVEVLDDLATIPPSHRLSRDFADLVEILPADRLNRAADLADHPDWDRHLPLAAVLHRAYELWRTDPAVPVEALARRVTAGRDRAGWLALLPALAPILAGLEGPDAVRMVVGTVADLPRTHP
jgi:hypothetical protein